MICEGVIAGPFAGVTWKVLPVYSTPLPELFRTEMLLPRTRKLLSLAPILILGDGGVLDVGYFAFAVA